MDFGLTERSPWDEDVDGLLTFSFEDEPSYLLKEVDKSLKGEIEKVYKRGEFKGKKDEVYTLPTFGMINPERLIMVGLGKRDTFTLDRLRRASAIGVKEARRLKLTSLSSPLFGEEGTSLKDATEAIVTGAILGLYRFTELKTEKKDDETPYPQRWVFSITKEVKKEAILQSIEEGKGLAESVNYVRDLVNSPSNIVTPGRLVEEAEMLAREGGIECKVFNREDIERLGMGAFLSVLKGSDEPAYFIILEYMGGKKDDAPIVLAGKAITFDSGGISIKPSENMEKMKYDMSGGGAVLGTMKILTRLKPPINVIGLIPTGENLPSGKASKPGDVVKSLSGKTIEIISTDAEGRMLLADALSYALRYKPKVIIDIATLTGACLVALGRHAIGIMGNDRGLIEAFKRAGEASGERVWELPLWEEYEELIKSDVADIKNVGDKSAGTIVGGIFLKNFVGDTPWVHLDIASTAWAEKEGPYQPKGATGVGVRLLFEFLKGLSTN